MGQDKPQDESRELPLPRSPTDSTYVISCKVGLLNDDVEGMSQREGFPLNVVHLKVVSQM